MAFPVRTQWYSRPGWSEFGRVGVSGIPHKGHDIYVPAGTNVYATGTGVVTGIGNSPDRNYGFGLWVTIRLDNGVTTLDAHFQKVYVAIGQRVTVVDRIGKVGNTGNAWDVFWTVAGKKLSHDHHEVRNANGNLIDPIKFYGVSPAGGTPKPFNPPPSKPKDTDMPAVIKRTEGGDEWSLVWPSLRGGDDNQRGYIATTDPERAKWWERFYERGQGTGDGFKRDEYVKAQAMARLDHDAWLAAQPVAGGSVDLPALAQLIIAGIPATDPAALATAVAEKMPTKLSGTLTV